MVNSIRGISEEDRFRRSDDFARLIGSEGTTPLSFPQLVLAIQNMNQPSELQRYVAVQHLATRWVEQSRVDRVNAPVFPEEVAGFCFRGMHHGTGVMVFHAPSEQEHVIFNMPHLADESASHGDMDRADFYRHHLGEEGPVHLIGEFDDQVLEDQDLFNRVRMDLIDPQGLTPNQHAKLADCCDRRRRALPPGVDPSHAIPVIVNHLRGEKPLPKMPLLPGTVVVYKPGQFLVEVDETWEVEFTILPAHMQEEEKSTDKTKVSYNGDQFWIQGILRQKKPGATPVEVVVFVIKATETVKGQIQKRFAEARQQDQRLITEFNHRQTAVTAEIKRGRQAQTVRKERTTQNSIQDIGANPRNLTPDQQKQSGPIAGS